MNHIRIKEIPKNKRFDIFLIKYFRNYRNASTIFVFICICKILHHRLLIEINKYLYTTMNIVSVFAQGNIYDYKVNRSV